ncbi:hypothetical protein Cfor_04670, partial [Coptotermes formosanus]
CGSVIPEDSILRCHYCVTVKSHMIDLFTAQGMSGAGSSPGPSLIPNGQPPQWTHPSAFPHAVKPRPPPTGSHVATSITSNGTPTPPSYSHP